jgi:cobalt-zinc-cadmium efflux system outer membrane protein
MKLLLVFLSIGLSDAALACENSPLKLNDVYKCIFDNHPSLEHLKFRGAEFQAREITAIQTPSAEIEAKTGLSGKSEFEIEILQPLDIGGRVEARKGYAQAENRLSATNDNFLSGEIARSIAENLTKLRQIEQNLAIIREARASTTKITKLLKAKIILTPEDRTTLGLMNMYEFGLNQRARLIEAEQESLKALIESTARVSLSGISWKKELSKKKWPALSSYDDLVPLEVRSAQAELALAHAEIRQVSTESSPTLSVGPTLKHEYEKKKLTWGVIVNLTLPSSNIKRGEQALAQVHAQQAEAKLKAASALETGRLESLKKTYEKSVLSLESAPQIGTIKEVISGVEKQFTRGLIQPSALIETYRSALETLEAINETELQAVRAYFEHETALGKLPKDLI